MPAGRSAGPISPEVASQVFGHLADGPTKAAKRKPAGVRAPRPAPAKATPAEPATYHDNDRPPTIGDYQTSLDQGIDSLIASNRKERIELDKEVTAGAANRDQTAHDLDASREQLLRELTERTDAYNKQINPLEARVGKIGETTTPEQGAEQDAALDQLSVLTKERDEYKDQQKALQRWHDRRQINSINEQLKDPKLDPKTREQLLARKKTLATGLLSTVQRYEQFDPRWGSSVYGPDSSYTNMTDAGCGPTGLADLLDFADQEDPEGKHSRGIRDPYTPRKVADYATTHGRLKDHGTDGAAMMRDLGVGFPGYSGKTIDGMTGAAEQLHNGVPVLFLGSKMMTGQGAEGQVKPYEDGHFMVLSGVNDDDTDFQVKDGGRNEKRNIHSMTSTQLAGHAGGYWSVTR